MDGRLDTICMVESNKNEAYSKRKGRMGVGGNIETASRVGVLCLILSPRVGHQKTEVAIRARFDRKKRKRMLKAI